MLNLRKTGAAVAMVTTLLVPVLSFASPGPVINILSLPVSNSDGSITYHIKVSNSGDQAATDVFIRSTLDANEQFSSAEQAPDTSTTQNSRLTLIWAVPSIAPGAEYDITLNTMLASGLPDGTTISNTVAVEADNVALQAKTTAITTGAIMGQGGADTNLPVTGVDPAVMATLALAGIALSLWLGLALKRA